MKNALYNLKSNAGKIALALMVSYPVYKIVQVLISAEGFAHSLN